MWKVKIKDEKIQPTNNNFVCGLQMIVIIVYDRVIAHSDCAKTNNLVFGQAFFKRLAGF